MVCVKAYTGNKRYNNNYLTKPNQFFFSNVNGNVRRSKTYNNEYNTTKWRAYYSVLLYKHSDADRRTGEREKINVQKTIAHAQPLQYLWCIKYKCTILW